MGDEVAVVARAVGWAVEGEEGDEGCNAREEEEEEEDDDDDDGDTALVAELLSLPLPPLSTTAVEKTAADDEADPLAARGTDVDDEPANAGAITIRLPMFKWFVH